jgi:D-cysteine desulfhydrase
MAREPYLFQKFPGLKGRLPWMPLGDFPTPVQRIDRLGAELKCRELYLKRDDLSAADYGGNKVRKLEFTLADVKARGRKLVITLGAVGSNHVLATTVHGGKAGLQTVGVFMPQPVQEYLRRNILCNHAQGCTLEYAASDTGAILRLPAIYLRHWRRTGERPYLLWFGGSSTLGVLGYVEAALEIAEQVRAGAMPEPEFIFVPVGSGGTLAGLLLGLKLAGLESTAVGVRVYDRTFANERMVAFLANRALRLLRKADPAVPPAEISAREIVMLHDYFGSGYARFTRKGEEAVARMKALEGIALDGAYSGKAMAAFIDFMSVPARRERPALFIDTYNSRPLEPLGAGSGCECLPSELQKYFGCDLEPVDG